MLTASQPTMPSIASGDDLAPLFARIASLARLGPPSRPCITLLSQLQPSVNAILATLSPTDAEIFRSVLDDVPLISHTPAFAKQPLPLPQRRLPCLLGPPRRVRRLPAREERPPHPRKSHPQLRVHLTLTDHPAHAVQAGAADLHFAARAALHFTPGELDEGMRFVRMVCACTCTVFAPLVAFRHACAAALAPLIDLGPPLTCALGEYAWTWRTCAKCAHHTGRGKCGMFCADAPWFVELWRELVAILRARPDPDAVLIWGKEHFSRALQKAMACPICVNVAEEHLKCFKGLLVVEAAKRIAEIPLKI
ncbi:hypothetical protein GSI_12673 [Ganoderma sinense ZZ0214-1]|uniref:Uncharacterized protein n=1 Tax=Ganoderma sinense ZZ0214-1 TaxID=1077348 RepID=A0A2G8RTE1_9APHY|nr:hypothetical protein GSI_12673 [Ganoderma sinense ZZ0214-1]